MAYRGSPNSRSYRDRPSHGRTLAGCLVPRIGSRCRGRTRGELHYPCHGLPARPAAVPRAIGAIRCALVWL